MKKPIKTTKLPNLETFKFEYMLSHYINIDTPQKEFFCRDFKTFLIFAHLQAKDMMNHLDVRVEDLCTMCEIAIDISDNLNILTFGRYPCDKDGYFHLLQCDDDADPVDHGKIFVGHLIPKDATWSLYNIEPYMFNGTIPNQRRFTYDPGINFDFKMYNFKK